MKKLSLLFLIVLVLGAFGTAFQSCDNSKTYAEMLEDERDAINKFIRKHNIKTISKEEFERDTTTNVIENEYVNFANGVYMQIIERGDGDTIRNRDEVILRMKEYNIMAEINGDIYQDTISNVNVDDLVDSFYYNPDATSTKFVYDNYNGYFPWIYGQAFGTTLTDLPSGIVYVMKYLKGGAHVKLIIPSKVGHNIGLQYVYPYFYEITKVQIR